MSWWGWALLVWAVLATVGVIALSAALYQRADQVRSLIDDEWPAPSRPMFR